MSLVKDTLERYSFSKLSSFHTCKYGYKLTYIDKIAGEGNAFSSYGTEIHSLLERCAKGEIDVWDLKDIFEWEWESAVPEKFPFNKYVDLRESYYTQAIDFLTNFQGFLGMDIVGVEEKFDITIDDWIFNGIVDLIYKDALGNYVIRDYKSKSSFSSKEEKKKYARQLYLYSQYVKEKYGKYPERLEFLMFRKNNVETIQFNKEDLEESLQWAKNTVKEIRECFDYPPSCDDFYGNNLCNHRSSCDLKSKK